MGLMCMVTWFYYDTGVSTVLRRRRGAVAKSVDVNVSDLAVNCTSK